MFRIGISNKLYWKKDSKNKIAALIIINVLNTKYDFYFKFDKL